MRKFLVGVAAAAALAIPTAAQAQLTVEGGTTVQTLDTDPNEINFTFAFGDGLANPFTEVLQFGVVQDAAVEFSFSGNPDSVVFNSVTLNGVELMPTASNPDIYNFGPTTLLAGVYNLVISGVAPVISPARASISGNVAIVSNVPEPATWAMLLVGFGAIGFQVRRRRQSVQVRYA